MASSTNIQLRAKYSRFRFRKIFSFLFLLDGFVFISVVFYDDYFFICLKAMYQIAFF